MTNYDAWLDKQLFEHDNDMEALEASRREYEKSIDEYESFLESLYDDFR
jgi:flagellar motility protein MotE (MotC chaperone)